MAFEELIEKPENYRAGDNYRATNIVFPVQFEGKKYVVKKSRAFPISSLIQFYYRLQENRSFKNRVSSSARLGLVEEIRKLKVLGEIKKLGRLNGFDVPELYGYDEEKPLLVREYLEGKDFRGLSSDEEIKKTLEGALELVAKIHGKDVIIGSAHIKNAFLTDRGKVYWLDFDGVFDETDPTKAKAADLLRLVYSTYTSTKDKDKTLYAAELVAKNYQEKEVKEVLKGLVSRLHPGFGLWFSSRLPLDGKLHEGIKAVLMR